MNFTDRTIIEQLLKNKLGSDCSCPNCQLDCKRCHKHGKHKPIGKFFSAIYEKQQQLMQQGIDQQRLYGFLALNTQILAKNTYEEAIRRIQSRYYLKGIVVDQLIPDQVNEIYSKILAARLASDANTWEENELLIFVWIVIAYLDLRAKLVDELTSEDYDFLAFLFNKSPPLIETKVAELFRAEKLTMWKREEDVALIRIFTDDVQITKGRWSLIAKLLNQRLKGESNKTAKQCRQRWLNHLDPVKVKGKWQPEEDMILLKYVQNNGKRWAKIAIELQNRKNQHAVKNRYNSLVHKKKRNCKIKKDEDAVRNILEDLRTEITAKQQAVQLLRNSNNQIVVVDPHEVETLANKREREGLFMISSRSYEDNTDLMDSLNSEQDMLRSREYVEGVYEAKDCTKKADHFLNQILSDNRCLDGVYEKRLQPVKPPSPFANVVPSFNSTHTLNEDSSHSSCPGRFLFQSTHFHDFLEREEAQKTS